jgi:hypothetical protein
MGLNGVQPKSESKHLGFLEFLRDHGKITRQQYDSLTAIQQSRHFFGVLALREGYISADDLEKALLEQNRKDNQERIGEIMKRMRLMSDIQIDTVLDQQQNSAVSIGQFLVDFDIMSQDQLDEELHVFETNPD